MKAIMVMVLLGLLNVSCAATNVIKTADSEVSSAVAVAGAWLELVDDELYVESWENSAKVFQKNLTGESWGDMAKPVKQKFGNIQKRVLVHADYHNQEKDKIGIKYNSVASNEGEIIESVYLSKEQGKWKVAGYWLK